MGARQGSPGQQLGAQRISNPAGWRRKIKAALKKCGGYVRGARGAAQALGVGEATLHAWIASDPELLALPRPKPGARPLDA